MPDIKISEMNPVSFVTGGMKIPIADDTGTDIFATPAQIAGGGGGYFVLQSDYTLTSTTALQKLFNSTTNGAITLAPGKYVFECLLYITGMSATGGNALFDVEGAGTAVIAANAINQTVGIDSNTPTANAAMNGSISQGYATNASMNTAAAGTGLASWIHGQFDVTTAGTIIPSIALVTAAPAVVKAGTFIRFVGLGPTGVAAGGNVS